MTLKGLTLAVLAVPTRLPILVSHDKWEQAVEEPDAQERATHLARGYATVDFGSRQQMGAGSDRK